MEAKTMKKCIAEAKRFVKLAEAVPIRKTENKSQFSKWDFVESGKASGAARRASMDLTRALADLRQGR
jgi:hypothetical protein